MRTVRHTVHAMMSPNRADPRGFDLLDIYVSTAASRTCCRKTGRTRQEKFKGRCEWVGRIPKYHGSGGEVEARREARSEAKRTEDNGDHEKAAVYLVDGKANVWPEIDILDSILLFWGRACVHSISFSRFPPDKHAHTWTTHSASKYRMEHLICWKSCRRKR